MMRKRTQGLIVLSSIALMLTACSHGPKRAELENGKVGDRYLNQGESPIRQNGRLRAVASEQEQDPMEIMKSWVVDSHPTHGILTSLDQIYALDLFASESKDKPWSGPYWPDRFGGVAAHYRQIEPNIALNLSAQRNYKKWKRRHDRMAKRYDSLTEYDISILSPAEKYDILMGDRDFTFTRKVWEGINQQAGIFGNLAKWSGICNGWTASSTELKRPRSTVRARSPDGKIINFYPDDIKGLASVLWAHDFIGLNTKMADGTPAMVMYGLRCDLKKPRRENGAVALLSEDVARKSPDECRDLNPAVWHMAIVNRTGVQKKSFVIDKDYDIKVNNHVAYGYKFKYFNVTNRKTTKDYRSAMINVESYSKDPFSSYRSPAARYIVGVEMEVKYIDYVWPSPRSETFDDESRDKEGVMKVQYDLELDADHKPIGGNWRVNRKQKKRPILGYQKPEYPDFMWYQRQWTYSYYEQFDDPYLTEHDWSKPIPEVLRERAKQSAGVVNFYATLKDRALLPVGGSNPVKLEARKASDAYDAACARLCSTAYPMDSNGRYLPDTAPEYNTPAAVAARKEMEPFDQALTHYGNELDKLGIPRSYPYVQPLGRVVYGLIEAAKDANANPPPRPNAPVDQQN